MKRLILLLALIGCGMTIALGVFDTLSSIPIWKVNGGLDTNPVIVSLLRFGGVPLIFAYDLEPLLFLLVFLIPEQLRVEGFNIRKLSYVILAIFLIGASAEHLAGIASNLQVQRQLHLN